MPVEFLGIATTNDASETTERTTAPFDPAYLERLVRAHEDNGWTRVLFAYGSSGPEPAALAAHTAARLQSIELLLAHRPNVSYPTYAAKTFATLDQLSGGRLPVHFITGGNDHEQGREGDTLTKDERYARTQEYIQIVKQAWSSAEPPGTPTPSPTSSTPTATVCYRSPWTSPTETVLPSPSRTRCDASAGWTSWSTMPGKGCLALSRRSARSSCVTSSRSTCSASSTSPRPSFPSSVDKALGTSATFPPAARGRGRDRRGPT